MSDLSKSFWAALVRYVLGFSARDRLRKNGARGPALTLTKKIQGAPQTGPELVLNRDPSTDHGTFGRLVHESGWSCVTLEPPWLDNKPFISCIPTGTYTFIRQPSTKYGQAYTAQNVEGRWAILIHSANLAGEVKEGYVRELDGCIALAARWPCSPQAPPRLAPRHSGG